MRAVDEQPLADAGLDDRSPLDGEFDADHGARHADIENQRALRLQGREAGAELLADLERAIEQSVGFDRLNGGEGGAGGERVAAERGGVRTGLELVRYLGFGQEPAHRDATR